MYISPLQGRSHLSHGDATDRTIAQWRRRLECVVQQQGGYIEHFDVTRRPASADRTARAANFRRDVE